jgi:hypothetical protein
MNSQKTTESDVEQKIILPLLTEAQPGGLGLPISGIFTKADIRSFRIGKGANQKLYYPDYLISLDMVPCLIVEAKAAEVDPHDGYNEARLYALEVNSSFPPGVQPCTKVISSNGKTLLAGYFDNHAPKYEIDLSNLSLSGTKFSEFIEEFGYKCLRRGVDAIKSHLRPKRFWRPRKLVGGLASQQEEVGLNSFGATVTTDYATIFNPASMRDRDYIAQNGYIPSRRRDRYVDSIDRVIRAAAPPSELKATLIDDTSNPREITSKLRRAKELTNQVLLIVGGAGSGKSTFVDYLRTKGLPRDVRASTSWAHIDMNPAPIARAEIYDWLRDKVIDKCREDNPKTDFDELETIKKIFKVEVERFRKGIGKLYSSDKNLFEIELAGELRKAMSDKHLTAQRYIAFLESSLKKHLIVVLDNCDKRLLEEQLLMFEVAQWLKTEFNVLVILPIREETYDNNQERPPLDTALKDLVFRIEPPNFQKILQSRIYLATQEIQANAGTKFTYQLPNGMTASYLVEDQAHYLSSIMRSVFDHGLFVRRLIVGLAGRNMRRAMEIFLEFCTSGHISEEHIFRMVQSRGVYSLPFHLVATVLLRSRLRFYDGEKSYLTNIFSASEFDDRPNFFTRILILQSLKERSLEFAKSRSRGYVRIGDLADELMKMGVSREICVREVSALAKSLCIISEDFRVSGLEESDLIALAPAGSVHLQIASDVYYLAAVAEDMLYEDEALARSIATRMRDNAQHLSQRTTVQNAAAFLSEVEKWLSSSAKQYNSQFDDGKLELFVSLPEKSASLKRFEKSIIDGAWLAAKDKIDSGMVVTARISGMKPYGVFLNLAPGVTGLMHKSSVEDWGVARTGFRIGDDIQVFVEGFDVFTKKAILRPAQV